VITQESVPLCKIKERGEEHTLDEQTGEDKSIFEYIGINLDKALKKQ
jgi:hypothetical protein